MASFTKRVYVSKKKIFIYGSGSISALFILLLSLSFYGITVTTSGNITCSHCVSYFNITLQNYSLCLGSTFKGVWFDNESKLINQSLYKADMRYKRDNPARWKLYELLPNTCLDPGKTHEFMIVADKKNPYEDVEWSTGYGLVTKGPMWYGGKLTTVKTYVESDIGHFLINSNLTSSVDYTIENADGLKLVWQKFKGKNDINYFEFRIKTPISYYNSTESLTCDLPYWYNYTINPKHLWCWENYTDTIDNITFFNATRLIFDHDFETYNISIRTIYWNETKISGGNYIKFNPLGKTIEANKTYELGFYAEKDIELGEVAIKFDFLFADNNLNMTRWNTSWLKCKKWTNTSAFTVAETEINFSNSQIPYADFMANFVDIRITNGTDCNTDGGTEIPFWRHPVCNQSNTTANCTLYINLSTQTFLMYYNASGVSDASNGWTTFRAFDDFNTGTPSALSSNWTSNALGKGACSGEKVSRNGVQMNYTGTTGANCVPRWNAFNISCSMPIIIEFWHNTTSYIAGAGHGATMGVIHNVTVSKDFAIYGGSEIARNYAKVGYYITAGSGNESSSVWSPALATNQKWNIKYVIISSTSMSNLYLYADNYPNIPTTLRQSKLSMPNGGNCSGQSGIMFDSENGILDDFRVRFYIANPPSWSIGAEETQTSATCYTQTSNLITIPANCSMTISSGSKVN